MEAQLFQAKMTEIDPSPDRATQRNPTCDIRTVRGGLQTCLHGWHLLDEDQVSRLVLHTAPPV